MAKSEGSKQKTKRRKHSQNNKKKAKQIRAVIQPRLPKTASEVSSNWKALAAVSIDTLKIFKFLNFIQQNI